METKLIFHNFVIILFIEIEVTARVLLGFSCKANR